MSDPMGAPGDTGQQAGDPASFGMAIRAIGIGKGPQLQLPGPGSVVAVVGPNNVGKSTLLREIGEFLASSIVEGPPPPRVVTSCHIEWAGTPADMEAWVSTKGKLDPNDTRQGFANPVAQVQQSRRQNHPPGHYWQWFVNNQRAFDREKVCNPVPRRDHIGDRPKHPFHVLEANAEARGEVQGLAEKLFDEHLEIDNLSGKVGFAVGKPSVPVPPVNNVSTEYAEALSALPRLDQQGDGMRCALGLLMPLITEAYCISLIDEPEAFLHPPQARTLGTEVANLALAKQSQVVVATHDKNFLQGLVESETPVAIIHLSRKVDDTKAELLDSAEVKQLWSDTTLRYGNALDGLFHTAVIVTEGDRDSQFYAAAIDHKLAQDQPPRVHNLMFLAAYGKTNLASIVGRLSRLGVRTVSTPDLDILNNEDVLRALVEAHGGDWAMFESNYRKATSQFSQPTSMPTIANVKSQIDQLITDANGLLLTKDLADKIRETVTVKSAWSQIKNSGDRAFKTEKQAATNLLTDLDNVGIVTVRVGELERFLTTADASKGPGFLKVAFDEGAHRADDAQKHATRLLTAAGVDFKPAT